MIFPINNKFGYKQSINNMSVKVAVRVRPFNQRQKFLGCLCCIKMKDKTTILTNPRDRHQKQHQFTFDYSCWSHDGFQELENGYLYPIDDRFIDQKRMFKELGEDIIKNAWNGFNCCLFAYGQTGAGKSYSMIGYQSNRGIVPMACERIFQRIQKTKIPGKLQFQVTISMLEIYNQKVQDLFTHTNKRPVNGLKIRENKKFGVYVEGITRYHVKNYQQIEKKMQQGAKHRSLAATLMNQYSSRAHTIVMIEFIQKQFITEQKMNKKTSLINLVDLAGSQRIAKTGLNDKDRLKQASQINKSLHTLGRVIENLAELSAGKTKNVSIPYRQSALTRILETALGGNSVTTMICAISPANDNYEQTLSTLRYADQTKKIKNKPIINESAVDKIIRELRQENQRLKEMLRVAKLKGINLEDDTGIIEANIHEIQREIRKTMQSFAINTDQNDEDFSEIMMTQFVQLPDPSQFNPNQIMQVSEFNTSIRNYNVFLTNLSQDPMLNYKIQYPCQNQLYIGNKNLKEGGNNKLILCGLAVEDRHARIFEINGKYFLQPLSDHAGEYTLVNGRTIEKSKEIFHNDRIIIGTNSVFLFKNNLNKNGRKDGSIKVIQNLGQQAKNKRSMARSINDQSLLLDDLDQIEETKFKDTQKEFQDANVQKILEKQIDYQFAINERQNKFETSTSYITGSGSSLQNHDMAKKLQDIENQFKILLQENQRKMKEKQALHRQEIRKVQMEREAEKEKLKQELINKQLQSQQIARDKQRIQKARDALIQLEKQRRQKMEKELAKANEVKVETKIQYVERDHHHYHYDYNTIYQEIPNENRKQQVNSHSQTVNNISTTYNVSREQKFSKQSKESLLTTKLLNKQEHNYQNNQKQSEGHCENNTTNSTTMMLNNVDQSLLLDSPTYKQQHFFVNQKQSQLNIQNEKIYKKPTLTKKQWAQNKNNEGSDTKQQFEINSIGDLQLKQQKQVSSTSRKLSLNQLNITDMLDNSPYQKQIKNHLGDCQYFEEDSNLLNISNSQGLSSFIPKQKSQQQMAKIPFIRRQSGSSLGNVSLNLSDDSLGRELQNIKEEELNSKIRELQQKLKTLQQSQKQKKQNIKNIRKSFVQGFGENPNSENFFIDGFEDDDLDLSMIPVNEAQQKLESTQFEKKLKVNMIQCQNQNIINQRNLQVRKRKREADELQQLFMKKQKRQIQKQLITLIPMLQKFNLWAREMSRNIEGKIFLEYRNFTNYEILEALKNHSFQGKVSIKISIINYEEGRIYNWPIHVFQNRYEIIENLFEKFLENSTINYFSDKFKDPFWEPKDFRPFAVGYLSLEPLSYALNFQGQIKFVHKGQIVATLEVGLQPIDATSKIKQKFAQDQLVTNQIQDPRQLLQKDLYFNISIGELKPTEHLPIEKIEKYFISYEIIEDGYRTRTYKTQQSSINKLNIMYGFRHSFRDITEHTLSYLADSPISFTLHLIFQFDDQLSNMTSSFLHSSDSSINLGNSFLDQSSHSSGDKSKSNASDVLSSSPPTFKKKTAPVIFQNTEVIGKIEKDYSTVEKKIQKSRIEKQSSSSKKKKSKDDKQCNIF